MQHHCAVSDPRHARLIPIWALIAALVCISGTAIAQSTGHRPNLVFNSGFDTDLEIAGWQLLNTDLSSTSWNTTDSTGSGVFESGSLRINFWRMTTSTVPVATQCVRLPATGPGVEWEISVDSRNSAGSIFIDFSENTFCNPVPFSETLPSTDGELRLVRDGDWNYRSATVSSPHTLTRSARIYIASDSSYPTESFDNLQLRPALDLGYIPSVTTSSDESRLQVGDSFEISFDLANLGNSVMENAAVRFDVDPGLELETSPAPCNSATWQGTLFVPDSPIVPGDPIACSINVHVVASPTASASVRASIVSAEDGANDPGLWCPYSGAPLHACIGSTNWNGYLSQVTIEIVDFPDARFTVDTLTDGADATQGDGVCATSTGLCTLRAAIQEANATPGPDTVFLPYLGSFYRVQNPTLGLDLRITDDLKLEGTGAYRVPIQGYRLGTARERIFRIPDNSDAIVELRNLELSDGQANGLLGPDDGGLIYHGSNAGRLLLHNVLLRHGEARNGGAIFSGDELELHAVTVRDSIASNLGGAVAARELVIGDPSLTYPAGSYFIDNEATGAGGAINVQNADEVAIDGASFEGNESSSAGGGLFLSLEVVAGEARITRSLFAGNRADQGGAIYRAFGQTLHLANVTLSGNEAFSAGGALYTHRGATLLQNATLYQNAADLLDPDEGLGGALFIDPVSLVTSENSIIEDNTAQVELVGGGLPVPRGSVCVGEIESLGYNRFTPILLDTECSLTGAGTATDLYDTPARLGPLVNNGGPTSTHAFIDDFSLAIDGGDPAGCSWSFPVVGTSLETDQRGYGRAEDGNFDGTVRCDVGAFERECGSDDDMDLRGDLCDNCPDDSNADQADLDFDSVGDVCDNCPDDANPAQSDLDDDTVGDLCDNCPESANLDQADGDSDQVGDACDNCPDDANVDQFDSDGDGVGQVCDNCPIDANANQFDGDSDQVGDACDNCPSFANTDQADQDRDGFGNVCDNCPLDLNPGQEDFDRDLVGDLCDNCPDDVNTDQADQDGDGVGDVCDNCPTVFNPDQADSTGQGIGDACNPAVLIFVDGFESGGVTAWSSSVP